MTRTKLCSLVSSSYNIDFLGNRFSVSHTAQWHELTSARWKWSFSASGRQKSNLKPVLKECLANWGLMGWHRHSLAQEGAFLSLSGLNNWALKRQGWSNETHQWVASWVMLMELDPLTLEIKSWDFSASLFHFHVSGQNRYICWIW